MIIDPSGCSRLGQASGPTTSQDGSWEHPFVTSPTYVYHEYREKVIGRYELLRSDRSLEARSPSEIAASPANQLRIDTSRLHTPYSPSSTLLNLEDQYRVDCADLAVAFQTCLESLTLLVGKIDGFCGLHDPLPSSTADATSISKKVPRDNETPARLGK